jgi:hypothetical protein
MKPFYTTEPLQTVIERADANNVIFAVNYNPTTKSIHVEFHAPEGISLVEVDIEDLKELEKMFRLAIDAIKGEQ